MVAPPWRRVGVHGGGVAGVPVGLPGRLGLGQRGLVDTVLLDVLDNALKDVFDDALIDVLDDALVDVLDKVWRC